MIFILIVIIWIAILLNLKYSRDVLASVFLVGAIIWLVAFTIAMFIPDNRFQRFNMSYHVEGFQVINITKDSLECEFYKQYLEPIKK